MQAERTSSGSKGHRERARVRASGVADCEGQRRGWQEKKVEGEGKVKVGDGKGCSGQ